MTAVLELLRQWRLLLLVGLLGCIWVQDRTISHLKTEHAQEEVASSRAHAEAIAAADEKYRQLVKAGAAQGKKDEQALAALAADRGRLERLLRNRPYRPAPGVPGTPAASGSGSAGATGAGLYREDGEFLAGEAAAAKRIAIERDSCLAQYHNAERQLNGSSK